MTCSGRSGYVSLSPTPCRVSSCSRSLSRSRSRTRTQDSSDVENPGNSLYVTGLSHRIAKVDLEKHFSKEREVVDVHLVIGPSKRENHGFGFVTTAMLEEANRCIKYIEGSVMEGRVITVEKLDFGFVLTMEIDDLCFLYHSGSTSRKMVGVVKVIKTWYESENGGAVDVRSVGEMRKAVDLSEIKGDKSRIFDENLIGQKYIAPHLKICDFGYSKFKRGPHGWKVWIDVAVDPEALLWKANSKMTTIGEDVGSAVAWKKNYAAFS